MSCGTPSPELAANPSRLERIPDGRCSRVLLWPGNLVAQVPGENIRIVGVLEASTGREQQVIVFIEVIDGADVEPRAVISINAIGGLMEYFSGY